MPLPQLGTLYPRSQDNILGSLPPTWTQPGGPGTRVFPQMYDSARGQIEPPMVPVGMYVPGCGHPLNCYAVYKEWDDQTDEHAALICCAACGYIQQIIEPYATYQNYIQVPIVVSG